MNVPAAQQPSTSFLVDLIPAAQRRRVYALFGLVGFLLFVFTASWAAISQELPPTWLIVLTVAHNASTPFFSALATANAVPTGAEAVKIENEQPGMIEDPQLGIEDDYDHGTEPDEPADLVEFEPEINDEDEIVPSDERLS